MMKPLCKPDEKMFIIDTGASITITKMMSLTSFPILQIQHTEITGIASGMAVHNMGTAHYIFQKPKMSLS